MIYRPGALVTTTELIAKDGARVHQAIRCSMWRRPV